MIELGRDLNDDLSACDPMMIEKLVAAASSAMSKTAIPHVTSVSEILSATLTLLDRTLRMVRLAQTPEDRAANTKEVARVLSDMLIEHGSLPN